MLSIRQRQLNLYYCGYYYIGKIDGIEGPLMRSAYGKFQEAKGLKVDKIYGPKTDTMLIETVKELQRKLNSCGAELDVDGLVGEKTIAAIKGLQKANGLVADGIAGVKTMAKLNKTSATWDNIKYFKRSEFRCPCGKCGGYPVEPDMKMVQLMDKIRDAYGKPITITSGVRCDSYNKKVGGINGSEHTKGKAADFYIPGQNDTADGRTAVVNKAKKLGAKYSYANTKGMGNAVHINI